MARKKEFEIFFGSNRNVLPGTPAAFGDVYNVDAPYFFRVGKAVVRKTASSWKKPDEAYDCISRELFAERPPEGDAPALYGSRALFDTLRENARGEKRDVIVFLHGFASTFDSAMERAAELCDEYLAPPEEPDADRRPARARQPLVFAFAWPSNGETVGFDDKTRKWNYTSDRNDAAASGVAIARCAVRMFEYLAELRAADDPDALCRQRVHLVAHSMGNWALRHAVQALLVLAREQGAPLMRLFDNVFLMAADEEDDALEREDRLAPLLRLARRVHVYHAGNDTALSLSDVKPGHGARLGHYGPANLARLNDRVFAVDCAAVSWTPSLTHVRHQYYRMAPEVTRDVRAVLADSPPDEIEGRIREGERRFRLKVDEAARKALQKA